MPETSSKSQPSVCRASRKRHRSSASRRARSGVKTCPAPGAASIRRAKSRDRCNGSMAAVAASGVSSSDQRLKTDRLGRKPTTYAAKAELSRQIGEEKPRASRALPDGSAREWCKRQAGPNPHPFLQEGQRPLRPQTDTVGKWLKQPGSLSQRATISR